MPINLGLPGRRYRPILVTLCNSHLVTYWKLLRSCEHGQQSHQETKSDQVARWTICCRRPFSNRRRLAAQRLATPMRRSMSLRPSREYQRGVAITHASSKSCQRPSYSREKRGSEKECRLIAKFNVLEHCFDLCGRRSVRIAIELRLAFPVAGRSGSRMRRQQGAVIGQIERHCQIQPVTQLYLAEKLFRKSDWTLRTCIIKSSHVSGRIRSVPYTCGQQLNSM